MAGTPKQQGEALRQALAARGRAVGSAQARQLTAALLTLAERGLLVAEGPPVYNMGPSDYTRGKKTR